MNATKIILLLLKGEGNSLRKAEIGNWIGVALAAPRTEWDELCQRPELGNAGVYILSGGIDQVSGKRRAYIGEAENVGERLKQHKTNEIWDSAIVFISRDDNVNKAHVRYLENRLLTEATTISRFKLEQNQAGGAKLSEGDREVMEDFLHRIRQLLPVLGSEILIPETQSTAKQQPSRSEVNPNGPSRPSYAGRPSIKGLVEFIYELKQKGKTLAEVIDIGQKGKYAGLGAGWFKDRWSKTPRSVKADNPINSKKKTGGKMAFVEAHLTAQGENRKTKSEIVKLFMEEFPDVPEKTARNTVSWSASTLKKRTGKESNHLPNARKI